MKDELYSEIIKKWIYSKTSCTFLHAIGVPTRRELTVIIILLLIIMIIIIIISWLGITGISLLTPVYINLIH